MSPSTADRSASSPAGRVCGALQRVTRIIAVGSVAIVLTALAGCDGAGRIELTALDYQVIDPPAPSMAKVDVDRAYWWTDEDGFVWIAMERVTSPLFGRFGTFSFRYSFAVEREPASKRGRNYILGAREFRAVIKLGPSESRITSTTGILALYPESGEKMRGSFKLEAARQVNRLLGGWGPAARYLLMGDFIAVKDAVRGAAIAAETESNGWERGPRSATQPVRRARSTSRPTTSSPATRSTTP